MSTAHAAALADRESRSSPIDAHVGTRIRLRRTLLGMSQETLGEALGLTFQQVQKYERGVNRVGASRLFDLSRVLDVPISFFFDDMPEPLAGMHGRHTPVRAGGFAERQDGFGTDEAMNRRETLETGAGLLPHHRPGRPQARLRPDQVHGPARGLNPAIPASCR